jgi:NADPH-dependent curcumin reductase CurA
MPLLNKKVVLCRRPDGMAQASDFEIIEQDVGELKDGQVLVKTEHLGIDAFINTTLAYDGHHGQSELRQPVIALGVGRVIESRSEDFAVGDGVVGAIGAQEYARKPASDFRKVNTDSVALRAHLGLLGMTTGFTAYAGMLLVGEVREGDTVAVSGAAGAVGTIACQLAKFRGARVIGIAGGKAKCDYLQEIGCDGAIDYKSDNVTEQLKLLAPQGLNVFFDNVGGSILDAALDNITMGARVVICGAISQYANLDAVTGPALYLRLAERNSSMRGFTVDYYSEQFPQMEADLSSWSQQGLVQLPEHIEKGLENFPKALSMLFSGGHQGKLIVEP